jgi:hypothetical protein
MFESFLSSTPATKTKSVMRIMSVLSLLSGIGLAFYGIYKGVDAQKLSYLCFVFIGSAFGGKVWQKKYEVAGGTNAGLPIADPPPPLP